MHIKAELSQIPVTDGRKAERRIVNIAAALREEGVRASSVIVLDVSTGGFKAECQEPFEEGVEVWLKLPGFEAKRSRVVWRRDTEIGCEFEWPLHEKELALLVAPKPKSIARAVFRRV